MSSQLYPEVIDASTLGARITQDVYLPIGVEGQADVGGSAVVNTIYAVEKPSDSELLFGAGSSLDAYVKFILGRGVAPVLGVASAKGPFTDELNERKAAWANLESDQAIRLRLADTEVQANLVALADSAENAELINNKQIAISGMASGTSKANLISAAGAINSKRGVLIGPAVYDTNGILLGGRYAAAAVACAVAMNSDITDDLDTAPLVNLTGIEKDSVGLPLFRRKVVAGVAQNDFEDLLAGGVSPLKQGRDGGVEITHLRTTFTTDSTYDSLMTRLIVDQVFIDVKNYIEASAFLRRGNTEATREQLRSGVEALLEERVGWISPKEQPDGSLGYNVQVSSSSNGRQVTVAYEGIVIRGISTIQVAAQLEIPV